MITNSIYSLNKTIFHFITIFKLLIIIFLLHYTSSLYAPRITINGKTYKIKTTINKQDEIDFNKEGYKFNSFEDFLFSITDKFPKLEIQIICEQDLCGYQYQFIGIENHRYDLVTNKTKIINDKNLLNHSKPKF